MVLKTAMLIPALLLILAASPPVEAKCKGWKCISANEAKKQVRG